MKNVVYKYYRLIPLLTSFFIFSCGYPLSTNTLLLSENIYDKLLSSPDLVNFKDKNYRLNVSFKEDYYMPSKCTPFRGCSYLAKKRHISILFYTPPYNYIGRQFYENFKLKNFWIISKSNKYFFQTDKIIINRYNDNWDSYVYIPKDYEHNMKDTHVVIELESEKGNSYIKSDLILPSNDPFGLLSL